MPTLIALADTLTFGALERRRQVARAVAGRLHREAARQASCELDLFHAGRLERFAVALTAPLRDGFALELAAAARDGRSAPTLRVFTLPGCAGSWASRLHREGVTDALSAELAVLDATASAMTAARLGGEDAADAVTWIATDGLHTAAVAAGLGLLPRPRALELVSPLAALVAQRHGSWEGFAASLRSGHARRSGSTVAAIVLDQACRRLLADRNSPWLRLAWADADLPAPAVSAAARAIALVA